MFVVLCILLVLAPAAVIASFPLHVVWSFRRGRHNHPRGPRLPRVSVIMPVAGPDEDLAACLRSLRNQTTSFEVEFIIAVQESRSFAGVAGRELPSARIIVSGATGDGLGKMHNLIAGTRKAHGDVLVFIDSDTVIDDPLFLERLVQDLARTGAGMVTCVPAYRNARNAPAAALASTINHDLPGYFSLFDCWTGLRTANGACLAISRTCLASIGGLEPLRAQLLMDTKLAQRVTAAGWRVHLHEYPVPVPRRHATWLAVWQQVQRWQTSMSRVLPRWQYLLFVWLRSGGIAALVLAVVAPRGMHGFAAWCLAGYLTARLMSAWFLNRMWIGDPAFTRRVLLIPVVELLNGASAIAAVLFSTVVWRGRRYRILRDGTAIAITPVAVLNDNRADARRASL